MCSLCDTVLCTVLYPRGHDHTAGFASAGNSLYSEAPKGREAPHVMDQALTLTDLGGLMREWLVKVRSLKLRYQFFSFHHPRLDQTGSACLSPVFCLTLDTQVYPILPLDAFWLNHFESIFTVLSLSFYFLLCIYTVVYKSPCLIVQVSSQADSGLGQQYLLHTGSSKPGIFLRVL